MNEEVEIDKLDPVVEAERLIQVFEELLLTILNSLGKVDLDNLKLRISWFFNTEAEITPEVQDISYQLQSITTPQSVLNVLITNNLIGYFNYKFLKVFQKAIKSSEIEAKIEEYEEKHNAFLKRFSFNAIIKMFRQCPNLAPGSVVGLPHVAVKLETHWEGKSAYEWKKFSETNFAWPRHLIIDSIKSGCIVLTYAVLPFFTSSVVKDLEDPLLLEQLEIKGVSVELSSDLLKLEKQDYECINSKELKEEEVAEKKESPFKIEKVNKHQVKEVWDTNNSNILEGMYNM